MLSACNTFARAYIDRYRKIFPNLQTFWAYAGFSPDAKQGSIRHIKLWDRQTRGDRKKIRRVGQNSATWSSKGGISEAPLPSYKTLKGEVDALEGEFSTYFSGIAEVSNPHSGPLTQYYVAVQRLLRSPSIPAADRTSYTYKKNVTVRLRYYAKVRKAFAGHHKGLIDAAFKEIGVINPDFRKIGSLTRAQANTLVFKLKETVDASKTPCPNAKKLYDEVANGLWELKSSKVPFNWIG